ncbi:hypothetical protein ABW19_dt0207132 [Dactylella cylindrospora]|nr:hypothetical protein ABW19_dt0207132 [Dactylella cylindrospora]
MDYNIAPPAANLSFRYVYTFAGLKVKTVKPSDILKNMAHYGRSIREKEREEFKERKGVEYEKEAKKRYKNVLREIEGRHLKLPECEVDEGGDESAETTAQGSDEVVAYQSKELMDSRVDGTHLQLAEEKGIIRKRGAELEDEDEGPSIVTKKRKLETVVYIYG